MAVAGSFGIPKRTKLFRALSDTVFQRMVSNVENLDAATIFSQLREGALASGLTGEPPDATTNSEWLVREVVHDKSVGVEENNRGKLCGL